MYEIIKNVIESKDYELRDMLYKINKMYIESNITEEQKDKLRGAIRFFNGDKNNIAVFIKIGEELKPCGAIYLTEEILKEFHQSSHCCA